MGYCFKLTHCWDKCVFMVYSELASGQKLTCYDVLTWFGKAALLCQLPGTKYIPIQNCRKTTKHRMHVKYLKNI